jgi:septum formation protein
MVMTNVCFKKLTKNEIQNYIETNEWRGKAGAYAIQGLASVFVKRINGSYSNVVGLPLYETASLLTGLGFLKRK